MAKLFGNASIKKRWSSKIARFLILVSFLFFSGLLQALTFNIALIHGDEFTAIADQVEADVLKLGGSRSASVIHLHTHDAPFSVPSGMPYDLVVTFGEIPLNMALSEKVPSPILATMVRKSQFYGSLKKHLLSKSAPFIATAVFTDQPIMRQLHLLECLVPDIQQNSIGVILGPQSSFYEPELKEASAFKSFKLNIVHVDASQNPVNAMNVVLQDAKVLLAVSDPNIYNIHTARGILLSASRNQVPVISFSKSYVNIGALAGVYSSPSQMASEISGMILEILQASKLPLPAPRTPSAFQVAINAQVAHALFITQHSENRLQEALYKMEKNPNQGCPLIEHEGSP